MIARIFIRLSYRYPKFMKDHCIETCGLCSDPSIGTSVTNPITGSGSSSRCYDKDKRCPAWAAYANQCQSNRLFMSRMCKKTCGLCNKGKGQSSSDDMMGSLAPKADTPSLSKMLSCGIVSAILLTRRSTSSFLR